MINLGYKIAQVRAALTNSINMLHMAHNKLIPYLLNQSLSSLLLPYADMQHGRGKIYFIDCEIGGLHLTAPEQLPTKIKPSRIY